MVGLTNMNPKGITLTRYEEKWIRIKRAEMNIHKNQWINPCPEIYMDDLE